MYPSKIWEFNSFNCQIELLRSVSRIPHNLTESKKAVTKKKRRKCQAIPLFLITVILSICFSISKRSKHPTAAFLKQTANEINVRFSN